MNKIVNKLFLIGNGFDMSLGLKTDYESFLLWYFKESLKKVINTENNFDDELIVISIAPIYKKITIGIRTITFEEYIDEIKNLKDLKIFMLNPQLNIYFKFNSYLFKNIYESTNFGWVDIEHLYYESLKRFIFKKVGNIVKLNSDLFTIQNKLEEYLSTLDTTKINLNNEGHQILRKFSDPIAMSEILNFDNQYSGITIKKVYFLNFNYTNSLINITQSFRDINRKKIEKFINPIHGQLNDSNFPIIFGFGDEMDKDYKKIEEANDDRYFEHIKSFKYLKNSNYRHLLSFLDSEDYQVCIYGHSCGLSDRIMLNEVFEHDNCKSIKIYHYENDKGENDFTIKTMKISRHFVSNKEMRRKIVNFNPDNSIPQF